ncbi:MAG: hypothetical protein HY866_23980 [Chloroflexi bacterium]|nr:hypothetical protein [Chloroflexota bacterium]
MIKANASKVGEDLKQGVTKRRAGTMNEQTSNSLEEYSGDLRDPRIE